MSRDEIRAESKFDKLMEDFMDMGMYKRDICDYCLNYCDDDELRDSPSEKYLEYCEKCNMNYSEFVWHREKDY